MSECPRTAKKKKARTHKIANGKSFMTEICNSAMPMLETQDNDDEYKKTTTAYCQVQHKIAEYIWRAVIIGQIEQKWWWANKPLTHE